MSDAERQLGFPGFATHQARLVAVPDEFFLRLLPQLDHLGELKLLLHIFWLLTTREATRRHVGEQELFEDPALLASLRAGESRPAADLLREAIERAVARRVLLRVQVNDAGAPQVWYFLNSPAGRKALATARVAAPPAADAAPLPADSGGAGQGLQPERPSIFSLYEQNIGLLTPLIADALRAAAERYPEGWLRDALREAAERNRRSWRYVQRILERWEAEGRGDATPGDGTWSPADADRYTRGRYGRLVQS